MEICGGDGIFLCHFADLLILHKKIGEKAALLAHLKENGNKAKIFKNSVVVAVFKWYNII